jgi:hypothetical protein
MLNWLVSQAAWLVAGLLAVALLVLLGLYLGLRRAQKQARMMPALVLDGVAETSVVDGSSQPTMLAFRTTLKRLADLAGVRSPYTLPWVLLLGDRGAGKTSFARAATLPRLLAEMDTPAGEDATLHCFESGVLIDAAARAAMTPDGRPAANDAWRRLMRAVQWYRPQRGLDGVILAISARDLMGAHALGTEMLAIKGDAFQTQLWDLQRRVGLRLPIYVVVTQCDHIPGFAAFWQAAPEGGTGTMLGWAAPRATDRAFDPADVDQAMAELSGALWNHYVGAAAGLDAPQDADGMFRFPGEFPALSTPLKTFLARALRAAAFQETHFLRGIWFTGAAEPVDTADTILMPPSATPGPPLAGALTARPSFPATLAGAGGHAAIASAAPRLLFVTDLLAEKVFAETGLAQPARTGLVARTRTSLMAQSALVGTTLVLAIGLFIADQWLRRTVAEVEPPLALIREEMANNGLSGDTGFRSAAAHRLLTDFEGIRRSWLVFPFIPSSWDGSTDAAVSRMFGDGLDHLVLKAMRAELERRYTLLREVPPPASLSDANNHHLAGAPDVEIMAAYLRKAEGLDRLAAEYATVNKGSVEKLANLSNSLFGTKLDGNFAHNSGLYLRGLHQVHIPPLSPDHARQIKSALGVMVSGLTRRIGPEGEIAERVKRLADAVADIRQPRKGLDLGQRMQDLAASLVDVRRMLDDPGLLWLASDDITTSPALSDLMALMMTSSVGPDVRNQFAHDVRAAHKALLERLLELPDGEGGTILVRTGTGSGLRLNDRLHALSEHFQPALNRPFMRAHPRVSLSMPPAAGSGQVMGWDPLALDEVLKTYRGYEEFRTSDLPRIPADFQSAVERMGRQRLEDSLRANLVAAQRIERSAERFQDFGEAALATEIGDLRQVSEQLVSILSVLAQNRLDTLHDELRRVIRAHVGGLLSELDELTAMESFYEPVDGFANWDGRGNPAEAGFYTADDVAMAQYLDNTRGRLEHLWNDLAAPLVDLIGRDELGSGWQDSATLFYWQSIGQGLGRYQAKSPGNSLMALESLLRTDLPKVSLDDCEAKLASGTSSGSGEFFQQRLITIREGLLDRCRTLLGESVNGDYAALADGFNRMLAGHYPFVTGSDTLDADLPEADPDDVVRFLREYAATGDRLRKVMQSRAARERQVQPALHFLEQMDQVTAFLAPIAGGADGQMAGPAAYQVGAEFRVNRPREVEANQIIEWALRIGVQELHAGEETASINWRPGDPVSLRLRWARDGSMLPQPAGDQPYVDGLTATFTYDGRWALLRLLQAHRASFQDFGQGGDRQPHTLRFDIPTAPAALEPGARPVLTQPTAEARVFVRVLLSSEVPAGDAKQPPRRRHVLPVFPAKAPVLSGTNGGDM